MQRYQTYVQNFVLGIRIKTECIRSERGSCTLVAPSDRKPKNRNGPETIYVDECGLYTVYREYSLVLVNVDGFLMLGTRKKLDEI